MDANRQKSDIKSEVDTEAKVIKEKKNSDTVDVKPVKVNKHKDANESRKSSKEAKSDSSHDSTLDNSNVGDERKSRENDPRTERRIRNKVIFFY